MIENRPFATAFAHLVLILGVLIVAFPIYYTFIASTQSVQQILRPPLPLLPGDQFAENYGQALFGGVGRIGGVSVWTLLFNTSVMALGIALDRVMCGRHWKLVPRALRNRVWGSRGAPDHGRLIDLAVRTVAARMAAAAAEGQTSRRADRRAGPAGRVRPVGPAPNTARAPPLRR